jgi:hypothetical protein
MPCVYNQTVRVAIRVDVGVVRAEEAGLKELHLSKVQEDRT